jgi:hypothetical protein
VLQKFEETLKPILNVESTKECMNIFLLTNAVFLTMVECPQMGEVQHP